ncbi:two-component sensor histidine kinase [Actinoplanes sp. LDG1-06]|uniref:histidine kinase n=1 Tax=Paractinoplanes ovalisporus TaxID=2810368 RepID=A0ABS2A6W7_9ACTN|nr:two-component sensor histidine kinase [Actinoplanes ovalisporus]
MARRSRRWAAEWRARPVLVRDGLLALLLVVLAFLPPLSGQGTRLGELPVRPLDALAIAAALAMALPLAVRRVAPAVTLTVVTAGFVVQELRGNASFASLGVVIALYSAAAYLPRFRLVAAGAATVAYAGLSWGLHRAGSAAHLSDYVVFYLCLAGAWLAGAWVRDRRAGEAERQRLVAAEIRDAERARIARELHDVVTHHVTAIVVQSGAAQFLTADPARTTDALVAIGDTGRRALGELRDLLGVLDPARVSGAAPPGSDSRHRQPGLTDIASLVERSRAAGQPVELVEDGQAPALSEGRQITAYRVVQESLTNAMKYATGGRTVVRLGYRPDGVHLVITTDQVGGATVPVGGSGRGLAGLRERVEVFGGDLTAGPRDRVFAVDAHIPADSSPPARASSSPPTPGSPPPSPAGPSPSPSTSPRRPRR